MPIFLFALVSPLLMRLKLERVNALLSKRLPARAADSKRVERTIRLVEFVLRVGRPFLAPGCVTRGLTHYYFLRRLGVDVTLVWGAGELNQAFAAHCWIERDNQPYLEKVDPRSFFVPIYRFGGKLGNNREMV